MVLAQTGGIACSEAWNKGSFMDTARRGGGGRKGLEMQSFESQKEIISSAEADNKVILVEVPGKYPT